MLLCTGSMPSLTKPWTLKIANSICPRPLPSQASRRFAHHPGPQSPAGPSSLHGRERAVLEEARLVNGVLSASPTPACGPEPWLKTRVITLHGHRSPQGCF